MRYYKAKNKEDYYYIASLFNNNNNAFLIKKRISCDEVAAEHKNPNVHTFIMEEKNKKIGWFSLTYKPRQKEAFIGMIIDKPHQGKGFGLKAIKLIEKEAKKIGAAKIALDVFDKNIAAINLYLKTGFKKIRKMIHMEKNLKND